jgi:hypothetical protein
MDGMDAEHVGVGVPSRKSRQPNYAMNLMEISNLRYTTFDFNFI